MFNKTRASMIWLLLPSMVALLAPSLAFALTDSEVEQQVHDVLIQRHPKESGDWWQGLGANAPSVIIRMYQSSDSTYQRLRLLGGLGWFKDNSQAVDFLKQQASHTDEDLVRETSIRSIGIS